MLGVGGPPLQLPSLADPPKGDVSRLVPDGWLDHSPLWGEPIGLRPIGGGTHQVAAIPLPIGRIPTRRTDPQDA